jgi:comEA protein
MPKGQFGYKAGKITFLLVCLCFLTACGSEDAVFQAGVAVVPPTMEVLKETQPEITIEVTMADSVYVTEEQEKVVNSGKININTAYAQELMDLPGIGESRAAAIIEYRMQTGGFQSIEEIMNVKGIGTGIFSKISSLICVK